MLPCPVPPPVPQDEATTLRTLNERLTQLRLKKGDYEKRIRELGSLPDEAFEKYRAHSLKRLQAELAQVGGRAGACVVAEGVGWDGVIGAFPCCLSLTLVYLQA